MMCNTASLLLLLPLAFLGCSSEPQVLETAPAAEEAEMAPEVKSKTGPVEFNAPEGWTEREPTAAMRSKEFVLGDDTENEVLVIVGHWPNGVGGLQANLQRWKGQLAGGENAQEPSIDTFTENGLISTLMDGMGDYSGMSGTQQAGSRLMAAYVESPMGRFEGVYTIKLSGSADSIEPWADSFRKFIQDL
ncbi:MAG: hypothetical protein JKY61_00390 [Planctomycetes bacterium]|nr:hypothetical protein [Planctomycetota bacterium]